MKRRSLPRQQVDFTVKRQEMNMMHGYKKMLVVKQVRGRTVCVGGCILSIQWFSCSTITYVMGDVQE